MKELINKIDVCEHDVEVVIKWLSEDKSNGLLEFQVAPVIRFLLKKISELEAKIEDYENQLGKVF